MASRGLTPFTEGNRRRQVWVFFPQAKHCDPQQLIPLSEGTDTSPRARDKTTTGGDKHPRPGTHHTAHTLPSPSRDQAAAPPPSPRLASSVSRRGISIDPRDMMATPLSAEPPARNGPPGAHFPSQTPTDPDVLGQRAREAGWLRPRGATSQSLCGEEGGLPGLARAALLLRQRWPRGRPSASGEAPAGRASGPADDASRQPWPRPRPRPLPEHYVLRCVTSCAAAHSGLPCGGLLRLEQSPQARVRVYWGLADRSLRSCAINTFCRETFACGWKVE
ncbi:uncharacterized protein FN964_005280 isoform 1-T4 [Alca torda]